MGNRTHVSTYGIRDRCCPRCRQFLRSSDFSSAGICAWCQWELDEPMRLLAARLNAGESNNRDPARSPSIVIDQACYD